MNRSYANRSTKLRLSLQRFNWFREQNDFVFILNFEVIAYIIVVIEILVFIVDMSGRVTIMGLSI